MKIIELDWCNWNEVCDIIPKENFISGTYLDEANQPCEDSNDNLGLKIKIKNKEYLIKHHQWIIVYDIDNIEWNYNVNLLHRRRKIKRIKNSNEINKSFSGC